MICPFCNKEMIKGKVCSNDALWWAEAGIKTRLNDEGGIIGRLNGDRVSAYRCDKCKKIIIDEK
ncbi:PF20097 family protein [Anaerofustis sp. HA2171]|uniref:PF20097 family protein n=1 Tax=Anaerofustis butyriciformans TaxID=3108533 RepID=UPI002E32D0EB|nr:PF20097 family protein [Anaerofustis sp. HA2171]